MITVPRCERPKASIMICSTRRSEGLRACLASLERYGCDDVPCETIVVANGADEDVAAVAHDELRGATVLDVPLNIGFAGAMNLARSVASADHLVLIHDDVVVHRGWLRSLVETADAHPEAGAVGSLALWPNGRVHAAGVVLWRGSEWTVLGDGDDPEAPDHQGLRAVDTTGSYSLMVAAATFDAVGGLDDELYPAGWVDRTLTHSIRRLGQVVLLDPRSRVQHASGGTLGRDSSFRTLAYARNGSRFRQRFIADFDGLPDRPDDPAQLASAIGAARVRAAADWRRRAEQWSGSVPAAPRVTSPFAPGAGPAQQLEAALRVMESERALRETWGRALVDRAERADADNALVRADRDRAIAYARSLEASRDETTRYARSLEAEHARVLEQIGARETARRPRPARWRSVRGRQAGRRVMATRAARWFRS